ncbi:STAS domain-containing protein [Streptomyces sp. TLI_171]|uniref:STAS domain-containing protein n=1 Tax=Streptomyces sp. TLI_171 TaxID=1938859 RepID=UPI000C436F1E|nr:STAS domain-containing protein [Streptomyces sp. TLI_171]RKE23594.1 anti-anti-sigma factor [Streptomyces sp. TLI_171]
MSEQDPGTAFHITSLRTPTPARILRLHGELDYDAGPSLRRALISEIEAQPPLLILDLSDLQFCDSSGLNEFLGARRNRHDVPLVLAAPSLQLRRILEVTQTARLFVVTESISAALAYYELNIPG